MPVRKYVEQRLTELLVGTNWFRHGICQSIPHAEYEAAAELASEIYGNVIRRIDWNRIMLEASCRCLALEHKLAEMDRACGECIEVALLSYERPIGMDDWGELEREPVPRVPSSYSMPRDLKLLLTAYARARRRGIKKSPLREDESTTL